jgi:arylsulfatase A-like enzyme/predicted dehydrogenase
VAGADPVPERVEKIRRTSGNPDFRGFSSAEALLSAGKPADVMIVATQDNFHFEHCRGALHAGCDVLLEKPISTTVEQVLEIEHLANTAGKRVMVCFVLRFAAFYRKVREIIASGALGEIVSIQASEGVNPWHQAHSFVRGHWSVAGKSSPMILSKCCHDTDIVHWLASRRCTRIASFGALEFFRPERAPAGAPARCTDGCPAGQTCPYNALRYTTDMRVPWLAMVYDRAGEAAADEIIDWLRASPWGRCVYHCDNDVVDRQVLGMEFEGGVTGTFTMTAFSTGRHLEICGTRGVLKGGESYRQHFGTHLILLPHEGEPVRYTVQAEDGGYELHGGGDVGLVKALYAEMTKPPGAALEAGLDSTVHSHVMTFAAEEARVTGRVVNVEQFQREHARKTTGIRGADILLKAILSCLLLLAISASALAAGTSTGQARPNFVIMFIDDLGYADIGPFGATRQRTPQLDRMAREGMKFTSFYAAPVCSVSRAQLLTGCYGARVSVPGVYFPGGKNGLNPAEFTIPERLKERGYATACVGKWHLGDQPEFLPSRQGFDRYLGIPYSNDMQRKAASGGARVVPLLRNEKVVDLLTDDQQSSIVERYTDEAVAFIREKRDAPFLLYLAHTAVHTPVHPGPRFAGKSDNGRFGDWVEEVDWSVGRVLETLRELRLEERTLVLFTSDNGPWLVKGTDGGSAGPLRGGKGSTWEGGVRVPTLAWWPGRIQPGTVCDAVQAPSICCPRW